MTINLIDARRAVYNKCSELFGDANIAAQIYRYLCDGIEDCEAVEAEAIKHGKWEDKGDFWVNCSVCGEPVLKNEHDILLRSTELYNYCPHCGAKMDEVEECIS